MPKKFVSENTKAVAAKARKSIAREEEKNKREKQLADEYWKDDDKYVIKKQQRKDDKEKKKQEVMLKKQQNKELLDNEMNSITESAKVLSPVKVTRAKLLTETEKQQNSNPTSKSNVSLQEDVLVENINHLVIEGEQARTVDEAIQVLSGKQSNEDTHPERRMKAAYSAFEDEHLPRLKAANPTLRLSQVKQLLRKEWMKSPSNPLNNL